MDLLRRSALALCFFLGVVALPSCGGGGGGGGGGGVSSTNSTIAVDVDFGVVADGTELVTITVTVLNTKGVAVEDATVQLAVSGSGNVLTQPAATTDVNGVTTGTLASTVAEAKSISAIVNPGSTPVAIATPATTEFVWYLPNTFFVRTGGADSGAGSSPATAWATIAHAATQVIPGTTVYVGSGTYNESVELTVTGNVANPIFFIGDEDGQYTGDAAGPVIVDAGGANYGFHLDGVDAVGVLGFTVTGASPGASEGAGIWVGGTECNSVLVQGNTVYGNDRGISFDNVNDSHIESNQISNNISGDSDGIVLNDADNCYIRNNLVYNNGRYGIHIRSGCNPFYAQLNTLYRNTGDQIHESGSLNLGVIDNSIITLGLADGIEVIVGSGVFENNNDVWSNSGLNYNDNAGGSLDASSMSVDPLFVDPFGPDNQLGGAQGADDVFLVGVSSPTIDAGDSPASTFQLQVGGTITGHTTRSDGALDGVAPDGATVNLGRHTAADSEPLDDLASGDARVYYGSGDNVQVLSRAWDHVSDTWHTPVLADPTSGTVKWVLSKLSPLVGQEELLAILSDNGTSTRLSVRLWNGSYWSIAGGLGDPLQSAIPSANANQRGFDIEYENLSGHAILVYANNTNNPVYRTYIEGVWSSENDVFATPPGNGSILWVEMAARPDSDEIALVCLSDTQNLTAVIWNGDTWNELGTATRLDTTIATTTSSRAFDLAYESQSGDLVVVWGHTNLIEEVRYAQKPAGSGTFIQGLANSADAMGAIVRLAPDPNTDRLVCALSEGSIGDDVVGMIWTGSLFADIAEFDLSASPTARDIAANWVGSTGVGVFVYKDNDGGGSLDWARYTPTGWTKQPDEALGGINDLEFIQGANFPGSNQIMILMSDSGGSLYALTYNATTWTIMNGGIALETSLPDLGSSSQPFHVSIKE